MQSVDFYIVTCALCGHLQLAHPGEPPSDENALTNFYNRCKAKRITGEVHMQYTKSDGEIICKTRDESKPCRFPLTDKDGFVIHSIDPINYKAITSRRFDVAKLTDNIMTNHEQMIRHA